MTRMDPEDPDADDVVAGDDDGVFGIVCPFCGEPDTLLVDQEQAAGSVYVEDCTVCCQPMKVTVMGAPGRRRVKVEQD